jgi:hypothetical protein
MMAVGGCKARQARLLFTGQSVCTGISSTTTATTNDSSTNRDSRTGTTITTINNASVVLAALKV